MSKSRPKKVPSAQDRASFLLDASQLQGLIDALQAKGYQVIGPTVRDGAVTYQELTSAADFPIGYTDEQGGGSYRLRKTPARSFFGYVISPQSWKQFLYPASIRLWKARRQHGNFAIAEEAPSAPKYAFIGVRACEIAAIAVQDKVLMAGDYTDPLYEARRKHLFIVAVNCTHAAATCFCTSMNTGPKATQDFDLALTEIVDPDRHVFLVEVGTPAGQQILDQIPHQPAEPSDRAHAERMIAEAGEQIQRRMDTSDLPDLLYRNSEHPHWEEVASRCLSCGNCTLVCPTCFCTAVEDVTDLAGGEAERWRQWDSCFTLDFSYIHGGNVRSSVKARYRQWLTHKMASWVDQFGTFGCVGCGRCITWCPVGIDITEEVDAIREKSPVFAEK